MRSRLILGIIVIILIIFGSVWIFNLLQSKSTAVINGHKFYVSIARSEQEKEIGLSNTLLLPKDQGVIFIFDKPALYGFWMRNMKYSLDIIYINNKKIVSIARNVSNPNNPLTPLPIYRPSQPADTVLEINGGLSNRYHFVVGNTVSIAL